MADPNHDLEEAVYTDAQGRTREPNDREARWSCSCGAVNWPSMDDCWRCSTGHRPPSILERKAGTTGSGLTSAADEHPAPNPPDIGDGSDSGAALDPIKEIRDRIRLDTLDAGLGEIRDRVVPAEPAGVSPDVVRKVMAAAKAASTAWTNHRLGHTTADDCATFMTDLREALDAADSSAGVGSPKPTTAEILNDDLVGMTKACAQLADSTQMVIRCTQCGNEANLNKLLAEALNSAGVGSDSAVEPRPQDEGLQPQADSKPRIISEKAAAYLDSMLQREGDESSQPVVDALNVMDAIQKLLDDPGREYKPARLLDDLETLRELLEAANSAGVGSDSEAEPRPQDAGPQPQAVWRCSKCGRDHTKPSRRIGSYRATFNADELRRFECSCCDRRFVYKGPDEFPLCAHCYSDEEMEAIADQSEARSPKPEASSPADNSAGVGSDSCNLPRLQDERPQPQAVSMLAVVTRCPKCKQQPCHECGCCGCDPSNKDHGCKSGGCPCFGPAGSATEPEIAYGIGFRDGKAADFSAANSAGVGADSPRTTDTEPVVTHYDTPCTAIGGIINPPDVEPLLKRCVQLTFTLSFAKFVPASLQAEADKLHGDLCRFGERLATAAVGSAGHVNCSIHDTAGHGAFRHNPACPCATCAAIRDCWIAHTAEPAGPPHVCCECGRCVQARERNAAEPAGNPPDVCERSRAWPIQHTVDDNRSFVVEIRSAAPLPDMARMIFDCIKTEAREAAEPAGGELKADSCQPSATEAKAIAQTRIDALEAENAALQAAAEPDQSRPLKQYDLGYAVGYDAAKAVADRDVLGGLTPAQFRAQATGEPHAAEPAGVPPDVLREYVQHKQECNIVGDIPDTPCTCGLDAALKAAADSAPTIDPEKEKQAAKIARYNRTAAEPAGKENPPDVKSVVKSAPTFPVDPPVRKRIHVNSGRRTYVVVVHSEGELDDRQTSYVLAEALRIHKMAAAEPAGVRKCRVCGCTSDDCRQCIEKTGHPCHWIETDLCSACAEPAEVDPWLCPECRIDNPRAKAQCRRCGDMKPPEVCRLEPEAPSAVEPEGVNVDWQCESCRRWNRHGNRRCHWCLGMIATAEPAESDQRSAISRKGGPINPPDVVKQQRIALVAAYNWIMAPACSTRDEDRQHVIERINFAISKIDRMADAAEPAGGGR